MADESGPSLFWNAVEDLHRGRLEEASVYRLREILEPVWEATGRWRDHPLANHLLTTWRSSVLVHLAQRLDEFVHVEGHERVLARLGSPYSYPTAHHEMDFALKARLAGIQCKYVSEGNLSTPDLLVSLADGECSIEVTSLNPPHADELAVSLSSFMADVALETRTSFDGFLRIPRDRPSNRDLMALETNIHDAAIQAQSGATAITLSEPIVTARFVSPKAAQHFGRQGSTLEIAYPDRPAKTQKLERSIKEKAERQLSRACSAALVVYDRFLSSEDEEELARHNLSAALTQFPCLAGVILIHPFTLWGGTTVRRVTWGDKSRSLGRHPLPDCEAESFAAWANPVNSIDMEPLVASVVGYPANLSRLYEGPQRWAPPSGGEGGRPSDGGSCP